jgi:hypothetical protein
MKHHDRNADTCNVEFANDNAFTKIDAFIRDSRCDGLRGGEHVFESPRLVLLIDTGIETDADRVSQEGDAKI